MLKSMGYVEKKWNDNKNHSGEGVTVYLNITDPDGTVRTLREVVLSDENNWRYTWTNLPKYTKDPETGQESTTPVQYSISEAYVPGYTGQILKLENSSVSEETWIESTSIDNGASYLLKTKDGYLSTVSADSDKLCFVTESVAKDSPLAIWDAIVSGDVFLMSIPAPPKPPPPAPLTPSKPNWS